MAQPRSSQRYCRTTVPDEAALRERLKAQISGAVQRACDNIVLTESPEAEPAIGAIRAHAFLLGRADRDRVDLPPRERHHERVITIRRMT
jgi:hypothetical protein